jgi:hypothetical protein
MFPYLKFLPKGKESGYRESNPDLNIGSVGHYHYATSASETEVITLCLY